MKKIPVLSKLFLLLLVALCLTNSTFVYAQEPAAKGFNAASQNENSQNTTNQSKLYVPLANSSVANAQNTARQKSEQILSNRQILDAPPSPPTGLYCYNWDFSIQPAWRSMIYTFV